jgi:prevent-host-death family protein
MKVYSYSEARQQLAELLNRARREGQVEIRRRDGQAFVVRPAGIAGSPLDVAGVSNGFSREEVVELVRESRRSTGRFLRPKRVRRREGAAGGDQKRTNCVKFQRRRPSEEMS